MRSLTLASVGWLGLSLIVADGRAAEPPRLRELRIQTVNNVTYFQARFDRPADLWLPDWNLFSDQARHDLAQLPRLVPQDPQTRDVAFLGDNFPSQPQAIRERAGQSFEFVGRCTGTGRAKLLLLNARTERDSRRRYASVEVPVELDFAQARGVSAPPEAARREPGRAPHADDLEGWWAVARANRFAALEAEASDFGFYGFARAALQRRYGVSTPALNANIGTRPEEYRRVYETTTGAAALTESLQLERMLNQRRHEGPRDIDIAKVPGIDIAEHPWERMMGDKRSDPEPLAKLVPHDNYYLHFKTFAKFIELGDFLDQWGTAATRAYEVQSRDYRLKERYEKQLCLKTSLLGRTLGPLVIKGLAVTGSDPYLREGSDVAVIFHVANRDLFRAGVEPYLRAARQEFGDRLREGREEYRGVNIDTFVTPLREVSLHRAAFDEFVVYANSPAGVRRILDARAGQLKPLADSLDFQYMRTVFTLADPAEDGFLYLSDAFIRQLVGPASKVKEKRRLEGLAGLYMAHHAALYAAWLDGHVPSDLDAILHAGSLKPQDLTTPDQAGVTWDAARQVAVSDRYNTIHFATPLVELPIDRVSREERQDYEQFRGQYLGLWRQYFDPVGMRFHITGGEVRVETYILPLIRNTQYNELRRLAGDGTVSLSVSPPTPKTVAQLLSHISPDAQERQQLVMGLNTLGVGKGAQWLGDWFIVRFDDSPVYAKLAELAQREGAPPDNAHEWIDAVFHMPVTFGVQIRNPLVFAGVLTALRNSLVNALPGAVTWEPLEPDYKGVKIVRVQATRQGLGMVAPPKDGAKEPFLPAIYYALVDGAWYASLQEQPIRDMIDRAQAPQKPAADARQVNSALFFGPEAATATKEFARRVLEREARRRALANEPIWYAFAKARLLEGQADEAARQNVLFRLLGYVPVSPEGAAYLYDPRTDEVTNTRHGSLRRPTPREALDPDSPVGQLLEQLRSVSADLRFREDGVHTTVTIRKK